MKILFVLEYYYPHIGGVETLFKSLVDQLTDSGHQVTIITQRFNSKLPKIERSRNCTIRRYTFFNRYIFTLLAFFPTMWHASGHDIIHTTSYNAGLPAFFAGFFTRKKVIITFHEYWGKLWFDLPFMGGFQKRLHYWFERFLVRLPFAKFVADSESTKAALSKGGVSDSKLSRIYCGLDYNQFEKRFIVPENDPYQFIYFGRLGISKGLDLLLGGAHLLHESGHSFKLNIVIPTKPKNLLQEVEALVDKYHLSEYINFHHELSRKDLFDLIQQSDCVVIPSYSEGFGFAAAESVALGMPIISSHQGSLPEVVQGKHLVMKEFSKTGLKDAMQQAMEGKWDYTTPKQFPLAEFGSQYIQLYKELKK